MARVSIDWPEGSLDFTGHYTPRLVVAINAASPLLWSSCCSGGELVYNLPTNSTGKASTCIGLETFSGRFFAWCPLSQQQKAEEEVLACCHTFLRSLTTSINGVGVIASNMGLGGTYKAAGADAVIILFDGILPVRVAIKNQQITKCTLLQHTTTFSINDRSIRKLGQAGADGTFSSLLHSLMSKPEVQKTEQPVLVGSSPNNKGDDGDASLVELLFQHMRLESSHETATCLVELNVTEVIIHQYSSEDSGTVRRCRLPWNINKEYKDYILALYYAMQWDNTGKLATDKKLESHLEYKLIQKDILAPLPPGKRLPRGLRRTAPKNKRRDPHKPRGYISAFNFFSQDQRSRACIENKKLIEAAGPKPSDRNNAINKILGKIWKDLSPSKRAVYDEMATSDKRRYLEEMESYVPSKGFIKDVPRINPLKDRVTTHSKKRKADDTHGKIRPKPAYSFFAAHEKHALAHLSDTGQTLMSTIFGQRWLCMNEEEISCYYAIERAERSRYEARCPTSIVNTQ